MCKYVRGGGAGRKDGCAEGGGGRTHLHGAGQHDPIRTNQRAHFLDGVEVHFVLLVRDAALAPRHRAGHVERRRRRGVPVRAGRLVRGLRATPQQRVQAAHLASGELIDDEVGQARRLRQLGGPELDGLLKDRQRKRALLADAVRPQRRVEVRPERLLEQPSGGAEKAEGLEELVQELQRHERVRVPPRRSHGHDVRCAGRLLPDVRAA